MTVTINNFRLWSNTYEQDTIRIEVNDGYYNPAEVRSDPDSYKVPSELTQEARDKLFSSLLAANLAEKSLKAFINASTCERQRPKIMNVVIGD